MTKYTEKLWQQSVNNRLQLEGETRYPIVNCSPLKVPYGTTREEEVKIISLFYKNNLLSGFLYKVQRELCPTKSTGHCVHVEQPVIRWHIT